MSLIKPFPLSALEPAFSERRVFITGHSGFKGSWLAIWLHQLRAKVTGYSLAPSTATNNFEVSAVAPLLRHHHEADIRDVIALRAALDEANPEVIFHLAAQPLVRESYNSPRETMETNFMGTCNLLEAVRRRKRPCVVIAVTSDKCYENHEQIDGFCESDPMGGHDPYSASKGAVELLVAAYRRSFFPADLSDEHGIKLASVRAGNVIGGGDWSRDRIVPDIVAHLQTDRAVPVRNPRSVRPWQHVLEPLSGYLTLAAKMLLCDEADLCDAWNFGPLEESNATVGELVSRFCAAWGSGQWVDNSDSAAPHEARCLRLSIKKAVSRLGWRPVWDFEQAIGYTARWYRKFEENQGRSMRDACLRDIAEYTAYAADSAASLVALLGRRLANAA